jgi:hypothetical protein
LKVQVPGVQEARNPYARLRPECQPAEYRRRCANEAGNHNDLRDPMSIREQKNDQERRRKDPDGCAA